MKTFFWSFKNMFQLILVVVAHILEHTLLLALTFSSACILSLLMNFELRWKYLYELLLRLQIGRLNPFAS